MTHPRPAARERTLGQQACDVTVAAAGPAAILVDEGRPGWAHIAVTESGAFDRPAYSLANRLVGNHAGAAVIEFVLGPVSLVFGRHATIAITGVDAEVSLDHPGDRRVAATTHCTLTVPAGTSVTIGAATSGLRGYLAVRGGWDVPATLGSRSHDTLAGLGPEPLRPGASLPIGTTTNHFPSIDHAPRRQPPPSLVLRLLPAPRDHALNLPRAVLHVLTWTIAPDSNRVGIRLRGPALPVTAQAASEPIVRGALQIPPDGQPVIMGPDHPTTGGYPVIGVVADEDTDRLAQARPGTTVRLRPVRGA